MKKNRAMRLAALMLVLVMMTSCFVGGTFAKYTSTTSGSDVATVAKWSFKVNGSEFAVNPDTPATLTFNLFDTIKDTENLEEDDVAAEKIAPGTMGSFALKIKNDSEVNAMWTVTLSETNDNAVPLQYSVDGSTWKDSIAELSMANLTKNGLNMGEEETVAVYWRWVFEGTTKGAHAGQTDAFDTMLGIAAQKAAPTVTITATLTAEQID